jgi:peptide-methionine (S)-S-oxide reductase
MSGTVRRRTAEALLAAALLAGGTAMAEEAKAGAAPEARTEEAIFGSGCFWCTEAVFERLEGVRSVTSGYTGGTAAKPTYKEVCSGQTGHAEAVRVEFDPERVSYGKLLEVFFASHDPTQLNRQGADVGTQYRSAVFYRGEAQKKAAQDYIAKLEKSGEFDGPIVTQVVEAGPFHAAEGYHQDFYRNNKDNPYCSAVIRPKLRKLGLEK